MHPSAGTCRRPRSESRTRWPGPPPDPTKPWAGGGRDDERRYATRNHAVEQRAASGAGTTMPPVTPSPLAGQPARREMLVDPARLVREYYERKPDPADPAQLVSFGTSGHRGSPLAGSFTEPHIAAITQAICDYRHTQGIDG